MATWAPSSTPVPSSTDATTLLQQIERNTSETVRWVKYLVVAVAILVIVTALLFV